MKKRLLICFTVIMVLGLFLSGCAEKECKVAEDCMSKTCFNAKCKENACTYSPIAECCGNERCDQSESYEGCSVDCPNCDDNNECTTDSFDYHTQECVNGAIPGVACCGNGVCELSEDYESCTRDCPNCDDNNDCTRDSYDRHTQECVNKAIIPCCGNGLCDEGVETRNNCEADCPDCDDSNKMTADSFDYDSQECEYVKYCFFEDFEEGTPSWLDPRWIIVDGVLTMAEGVDRASADFGNHQWTDYTLKLKIKLEQGTSNVYVRAGHGDGAYGYGVTISKSALTLWKDIDEGITLEGIKIDLDSNQFNDIQIEVKGNNIRVYVNGNLEIDYTDTDNPLLDGRARMGVYDLGIYLDDISVEGLCAK